MDVRPSDFKAALSGKEIGDGGKSIDFVKAAQARGIKVLAIIKSNDFQPYISYPYRCGLKLCFYDWGKEWQNYVKKTVTELKPYNVTDWQIDNELNNFLLTALNNPANNPAQNTELRDDIIKEGVSAAKSADPDGIIWVNLYYSVGGIFPVNNDKDIKEYAKLRDSGTKIDILGLDIYRNSYSEGRPEQYAKDLVV